MTDETILSKMAVTRLSHDLAGVIGAVANSLELLAESETTDAESLRLAQSGAECLVSRLTFFRQAYGNDGAVTTPGMTESVLKAYLNTLENKSLKYETVFDVDAEVPLFVLRLALLAGQICSDSLVRGGKIAVKAKAGEKRLTVGAVGEKIKIEQGTAALLNNEDVDVSSPRQTGAALAAATATTNWAVCAMAMSSFVVRKSRQAPSACGLPESSAQMRMSASLPRA